jgi:hypothetical protein
LLPGKLALMLLENALTGVQSEAGERFVFLIRTIVSGDTLRPAIGQAGVGEGNDGDAIVAHSGNGQGVAAVLMHHVESVVDDLHADLEQLVGISADY